MAIGLLILARTALAWESEPAELQFEGVYDLSSALEYDSGWLPAGSPLAIQLLIERNKAEQGLLTEMTAWASLSWPEALTLAVDGEPESGWFALLTDLHLSANVQFDLFGFKFSDELWGYDLRLEDEAEFDPLVLPGGAPDRIDLTGSAVPFTWEYLQSVFVGLDLGVSLDVVPIGYATLTGDRVEAWADGASAGAEITEAGATALLPMPAENPGLLGMDVTWFGALDGALAITFRPALEVCVIGSCFEVLSFDLPVDLAEVDEVFTLGPLRAEFPLPALDPVPTAYDFGEVDVGAIATWELPIGNLGLLDVEGLALADGAAYTVFPSGFVATPVTPDGVVITFEPTTSGEITGTLTLTTNDPLYETVTVALTGTGVLPPQPEDTTEPPDTDTEVLDDEDYVTKVCGCASAPASSWGWSVVAAAYLLARRARRPRSVAAT
jgi:MYXO-CTERM domain-containing protein